MMKHMRLPEWGLKEKDCQIIGVRNIVSNVIIKIIHITNIKNIN